MNVKVTFESFMSKFLIKIRSCCGQTVGLCLLGINKGREIHSSQILKQSCKTVLSLKNTTIQLRLFQKLRLCSKTFYFGLSSSPPPYYFFFCCM